MSIGRSTSFEEDTVSRVLRGFIEEAQAASSAQSIVLLRGAGRRGASAGILRASILSAVLGATLSFATVRLVSSSAHTAQAPSGAASLAVAETSPGHEDAPVHEPALTPPPVVTANATVAAPVAARRAPARASRRIVNPDPEFSGDWADPFEHEAAPAVDEPTDP